MKWLNKFENGGQVENTLRKVMSSLTSLIKRSQKNDPEAKKQIQAILDDPNAQQMLAMIEQQSPELIEALHAEVQDVQMAQTGGSVEYLDSLKCGGRVKKAKKKEEGGEMTKNRIKTSRLAKGAKAPCPCSLKRIGGTIVEVDCEGIPVHKVGGKVQKFEDGKTIWQKWWGKITQKLKDYEPEPVLISHEPTGRETAVMMMPGYDYKSRVGGFARISDQYNNNIFSQEEYVAAPDGRWHSIEGDIANNVLNANKQPLLTTTEIPSIDTNRLKTIVLNKQTDADLKAQQTAQVARDARVRTFYSKMSDSDKRALQDMLKSAGYYKGEIDGLIGNGTLSALRKFQQDNKLAVDGMAGRNTFDALRAKTRQVAQPTTDLTAVPGYTQAMQLLNQMNGSVSAAPVKTGGPTGGMGLNDVHQGRDAQLVGPKVGLNLTAGLEIPQRKQGGWLTKFN